MKLDLLNEKIKIIENAIGTDELELAIYDAISEIEQSDYGFEAVDPLLNLIEKYPLENFGSPGALVHFVETFYCKGYEGALIASIKKQSALHTLWMLNRVINGEEDKIQYINLLKEIANDKNIYPDIAAKAAEFMKYQLEG